MIRKISAAFTVSAALATISLSAPAFADGIAALKNFNAATDSISGTFSQSVSSKKKTQNSSGTFQIRRPGLFRWEYSKPYQQLIVGDGKTVWLYDQDLNQVIKKNQQETIGDSPAAILSSKEALERNFTLSDGGTQNGTDYVNAVPKSRNSGYQSVRIGFKNGTLAEMQLKDSFGNQTAIRFGNVRTGVSLSSGAFRFTPPKGADVLSQ